MTDYVTLFGAGPSGKEYAFEAAGGVRTLAYAAEKPFDEKSAPPDPKGLAALLRETGGVLVQELAKGTSVDVSCATYAKKGGNPSGRALWLRIRSADTMEPLGTKMSLSIGDHLIVPVDGEAEALLAQFCAMVERFPEETKRSILATLRRPTLDWEVDQIKAILSGNGDKEKGAGGLPGVPTKKRSKAFVGAIIVASLVLLGALAAGGYLGLRALHVVGTSTNPEPPPSSASPPQPTTNPTTASSASAAPEAPKPTPEENFASLIGALASELANSADPNLRALTEKLRTADGKITPDAALILAILFHRASGSDVDVQAYKAPSTNTKLKALLDQSVPRRRELVLRAVCAVLPAPAPAPSAAGTAPPKSLLPGREGCPANDLKIALEELQWIIDYVKHQNKIGMPVK